MKEGAELNESLRSELLAMRDADLQLRDQLMASRALFDGYNEQMAALHRENAGRLGEILSEYGWPGRSLVGDDGCSAAWLILQHAIEQGDAPAPLLAYLTDRIQTLQGLPQVYGTQHDWDDSGSMSPLPVQDAANVNQRLAALGMEPVEVQTDRLRKEAARAGSAAPADMESYRRSGEEWARSVGWRS